MTTTPPRPPSLQALALAALATACGGISGSLHDVCPAAAEAVCATGARCDDELQRLAQWECEPEPGEVHALTSAARTALWHTRRFPTAARWEAERAERERDAAVIADALGSARPRSGTVAGALVAGVLRAATGLCTGTYAAAAHDALAAGGVRGLLDHVHHTYYIGRGDTPPCADCDAMRGRCCPATLAAMSAAEWAAVHVIAHMGWLDWPMEPPWDEHSAWHGWLNRSP